jgi:purine-nucleoside phosphorylase
VLSALAHLNGLVTCCRPSVEHQVAALLVYAGETVAAVKLVSAVRDRHDEPVELPTTRTTAAPAGVERRFMTIHIESGADSMDPYVLADASARRLAQLTEIDRHDVAIVMGSGWGVAAEALGEPIVELSTTDLPGFRPAAAAGHAGTVRSVQVGSHRVLVFMGRTHLYEGHGPNAVAHAVRTACAAGCNVVVLTNACGGLRREWIPGTPVLLRDHINLTGMSPLTGPRFVDLSEVYSRRLRTLCQRVFPGLDEGVYAQFPGPHYETPAEVEMARLLGADLVGMSTTLEAIAAREAGAEVLGISLVTNLAAGISKTPLSHAEVIEAGRAAGPRVATLIRSFLEAL